MAYADVFTALADPTRRHIFEALRGQPKTVGELAVGEPVSRPAVSQHLKVLVAARLVSVEPKGNRHFYLIKSDGLDDLRQYLESFWSDALSAYGAEITRRMENQYPDAGGNPNIERVVVAVSFGGEAILSLETLRAK